MVNLSAIPATLYMFYYVSVDLDTCYMLDPLRQSFLYVIDKYVLTVFGKLVFPCQRPKN